jgi:hypothetical protein
MSSKVTLEQVAQLSAQLSVQEQLKLLKILSERLTEAISLPGIISKKERVKEATAILRECNRVAAAFKRKTDSVVSIRRIREERQRQICQSES